MNKRIFLSIATLASLALVVLGCGVSYRTAAVPDSPTVARIQQRGTVLVGTTGDYRPLSYREPETGAYWGFCLDVAGEIAKAMTVTVSYVPTSWPTLTADVQDSALFDFAIGGITITDTRLETMDMSDTWAMGRPSSAARKMRESTLARKTSIIPKCA